MKFVLTLLLAFQTVVVLGDDIAKAFQNPPASARPWVYWFWNNGNVTKEGITADLEAMQRAGIGGVIIMDVVERFAPPPGDADFMSEKWVDLFCFAVSEARRLGLEINMTNGPGWCGSSGPWITPELSMQELVGTSVMVEGPQHYSSGLPRPDAGGERGRDVFDSKVSYQGYYKDIAVLAIPQLTNAITASDVINLTEKLDSSGKLDWEVPSGKWTIQRIGHKSTGSSTRPPVKGGNGLECDKLSREGIDAHFGNMLGKLIPRLGKMVGPVLSATHIDSWEVGSQNWTPRLKEEFLKRRGYDLTPFLPNLTGKCQIGNSATSARFQWDFQQTISELLAENYVGRLAELAHQHKMRLTIEGYNLPFGDEALYTQYADEPMSEFWTFGGNETLAKARQMASVAHIMGKKIVGQEAFTSDDNEQWKLHPASIKALGDYQFSQGINRFVIHRYAHQPYLDRYPGVTMGPWGLHYERTQTWWEMSQGWHEYLARCQYMLRQGLFVADLCYLRPELPNQTYFTPSPEVPPGYKYDECSAQALISRMNVKNGRLVLPDGMSYGLLVLPDTRLMTPALSRKIKELVKAGAIVLGAPPKASPSLGGFPQCDAEVSAIVAEVWGNCDGTNITEHSFGKGRVIWGKSVAALLKEAQTPADFTSTITLNWIHRKVNNLEVYFVANPLNQAIETQCSFRVKGAVPELWDPETGSRTTIPFFEQNGGLTTLPLRLERSGSMFIVFHPQKRAADPVVSFTFNGISVVNELARPIIKVQKAIYGVPGDAARSRDVQARVQLLADGGELDFKVEKLAVGDDPAYGTVKTVTIDYSIGDKVYKISGQDTDRISLLAPMNLPDRPAELRAVKLGSFSVAARQTGRYEIKTASGKSCSFDVEGMRAPVDLSKDWEVRFAPNWGAPELIIMESLSSWSESTNAGVKYFSGSATYSKSFAWDMKSRANKEKSEFWLDLGDVQVMAQVKLNGKEVATLWKPPFRLNITDKLVEGQNKLEIKVANLWPNRMIGDAGLPKEQRLTWSSFEPFRKDTPLLISGLLGPVMIRELQVQKAELR